MRRLVVILAFLMGAACARSLPTTPDDDDDADRLWSDEVIYQILTDRFANGDPGNDQDVDLGCAGCYHGGDWQGIIDQLDYLEGLGVTAIWISPVMENADSPISDAYHGYWPSAFDRPNPHFGELADLHALVDACHARNIRVIVDVVINHLGPVFYYDINENGTLEIAAPGGEVGNELAPPYASGGVQADAGGPAPVVFFDENAVSPPAFRDTSWYNRRGQILDFNDPEQSLLGDFKGGLRDLDTSRSDVRAAVLDITLNWLSEVELDGLRYDAAKHVEPDVWPDFLGAVRASHDNLFQFPEVLDGFTPNLVPWTQDGKFDSVLDFATKFAAFDEVFAGTQPTTRLEEVYRDQATSFATESHEGGIDTPPNRALVRFLDNHDVPRFASFATAGARNTALAYLLTSDGIPVIYYGTEQGFDGAIDPANREDLWDSGYDTSHPVYQWIAELNEIRSTYEVFRRGDTRYVWTTDHTGGEVDAGLVAYERFTATERALVVINVHDAQTSETRSVGAGTMQVSFAPGTELVDLLDSSSTYTVEPTGELLMSVPPRGTRILVPAATVQ